jgi:hypothetical protein
MKCCYCGKGLDGGYIKGNPRMGSPRSPGVKTPTRGTARPSAAQARGRTVHPHEAPQRALAAVHRRGPARVGGAARRRAEACARREPERRVARGHRARRPDLYLEATANPPEPAIDATAEVEADVPELPPAAAEALDPRRDRPSQRACLKVS